MKKGNVTILASIFVMALVAAGVGAGTMAWFSAGPVTAESFTMNTATMSMSLVEATYNFDNLKLVPGQEFGPIVITITNTGNMDIKYLSGSMVLTSGSSDLAGKIEIVDWYEYIPGYGWMDNLGQDFKTTSPAAAQNYETLVKDGQSPLTLLELAQSYSTGRGEPYDASAAGHTKVDQWGKYKMYDSDWLTGGGYDEAPGPAIINGGTYYMKLYFKFSTDADNTFQNKSVSFKITFLGMQDYLSQRP
jgi:hypothetical protein